MKVELAALQAWARGCGMQVAPGPPKGANVMEVEVIHSSCKFSVQFVNTVAFVNTPSTSQVDFDVNNLYINKQNGLTKRIIQNGGTLSLIVGHCMTKEYVRLKPKSERNMKKREKKLTDNGWYHI